MQILPERRKTTQDHRTGLNDHRGDATRIITDLPACRKQWRGIFTFMQA